MQKDIDTLFGHLWDNYIQVTPSAHKVHQLLGGGEPIVNDHVAFRTYNLPKLGLEKLAAHFLALGYEQKGEDGVVEHEHGQKALALGRGTGERRVVRDAEIAAEPVNRGLHVRESVRVSRRGPRRDRRAYPRAAAPRPRAGSR